MANRAPLTEEERTDLIAYLDGELDRKAARALEAKLQVNPAYRLEAEKMRRTWDLLDHLPRPEPSLNFTHQTMERVTRQMPAARSSHRDRWPPWVSAAGWVAAALLLGSVGFAATRLLSHRGAQPRVAPDDGALHSSPEPRGPDIQSSVVFVPDQAFLLALDEPELAGNDGQERYLNWFERLPEADRASIQTAPDSEKRLRRVKDIREREWVEHLPKAQREELEKAPPALKAARIQALKQEAKKQRADWQLALKNWNDPPPHKGPMRLAEYPNRFKSFVTQQLVPKLTTEEKNRLIAAEGKPDYPRVLWELIYQHHRPEEIQPMVKLLHEAEKRRHKNNAAGKGLDTGK